MTVVINVAQVKSQTFCGQRAFMSLECAIAFIFKNKDELAAGVEITPLVRIIDWYYQINETIIVYIGCEDFLSAKVS